MQFGDHLTSVSTIFTPGQPLETQRYHPYGTTRTSTGLPTEYGYTSQRLDPTGLYHYRARPYDPITGRFTTPDTIIPTPNNPETLNRYTYTNNNPTTWTDPTGHCPTYGASAVDCYHNEWQRSQATEARNQQRNDAWHTGLDVGGVLFEPIDVANGIWYATEEKWLDAGLSLLSIIPLLGDLIGKGTRLCIRYCDELGWFGRGDRIADAPRTPSAATSGKGAGWRGTNGSVDDSISYHWNKHGAGRTLDEYLADAQRWAQSVDLSAGKPVTLADGTQGFRIRTPGGGPGGIVDADRNLITFWYR